MQKKATKKNGMKRTKNLLNGLKDFKSISRKTPIIITYISFVNSAKRRLSLLLSERVSMRKKPISISIYILRDFIKINVIGTYTYATVPRYIPTIIHEIMIKSRFLYLAIISNEKR